MNKKIRAVLSILLTAIMLAALLAFTVIAADTEDSDSIRVIVYVEPSLDLTNVYAFNEGLAIVEKGNNYGLMDKTGYMVVPPWKYKSICGFSEGLAGVQLPGTRNSIGPWGFIDKIGELVILPFGDSEHNLHYFKEGLARMCIDGKTVYIDKTGEVVITVSERCSYIYDFNDGLARAYDSAVSLSGINYGLPGYGYIDKTGELVIPFEYNFADDFSEGLAAVAKGDWYSRKYGYIDTSGKVVVPFEYDMAYPFKDGFAVVSKGGEWTYDGYINGKYGYIDESGKVVVPLEYDSAESFSEGFAAVSKGGEWIPSKDPMGYVSHRYSNGKYGYIDKTGKIIAPLEYESARSFKEGCAVVSRTVSVNDYADIRYGYIDTTGELVIPFQYSKAYDFSEGLAAVYALVPHEDDEIKKCGYIDKKGRVVVPFEYDEYHNAEYSYPFREGLAVVRKDGKWGILKIFGTGDPIGDVLYSDITAYINGNTIPTSVINGKTLVVVEDLAKYGFDVFWNGNNRTLKAEINKNKKLSPLKVEKDTKHKPGTFKCNYLYTDIKTYLSGEVVESYAIDGRTLIDFELLKKYGKITWDSKARELRLVID